MAKHTARTRAVAAVLILGCFLQLTVGSFAYAANSTTSSTNDSTPVCDPYFMAQNDVLYYDCSCSATPQTTAVADSSSTGSSSSGGSNPVDVGDGGGCGVAANGNLANELQAQDYFMKQFQASGYTQDEAQKATAGILGNWQQESAFNPARHDGQGCDAAGAAYGIAQWCGGRITNVKNYNATHGKPADCLGGELEYAWTEMSNDGVIKQMKGQSASDAAGTYMRVFEVAGVDGNREGKAQAIYNQMINGGITDTGSGSAAGTPTGGSGSDTSSGSAGCGTVSAFVDNSCNRLDDPRKQQQLPFDIHNQLSAKTTCIRGDVAQHFIFPTSSRRVG